MPITAKLTTSSGETIVVSIKTINPNVAKDMLAKHGTNRSVKSGRVRRLTKAMQRGEWTISQPLMFDSDGKLLDGQHRLLAVIAANRPIEFLCIDGYRREEVFARVDDVSARSLADWLHIRGIENHHLVASIARMMILDDANIVPTKTPYTGILQTPKSLADYCEENLPEIMAAVAAPGTINRMVPRSMACFAWLKFARLDRTLADSFFVDLVTGHDEGPKDPIYQLRERLIRNRATKEKLPRIELLALIFKAWNYSRTGKRIEVLVWRSSGPTAERFPEPI